MGSRHARPVPISGARGKQHGLFRQDGRGDKRGNAGVEARRD